VLLAYPVARDLLLDRLADLLTVDQEPSGVAGIDRYQPGVNVGGGAIRRRVDGPRMTGT